jgi:hypothetical protein
MESNRGTRTDPHRSWGDGIWSDRERDNPSHDEGNTFLHAPLEGRRIVLDTVRNPRSRKWTDRKVILTETTDQRQSVRPFIRIRYPWLRRGREFQVGISGARTAAFAQLQSESLCLRWPSISFVIGRTIRLNSVRWSSDDRRRSGRSRPITVGSSLPTR